MRKLTVVLFSTFVLWSSYKGYWFQHDTFPTEESCKAKASVAADEWWSYWLLTGIHPLDSEKGSEYRQMHQPLMKGKYSCWPQGRDLMVDPPAPRKRMWPTMQGQQP